jgi:hypothetical protein
LFATLQSEAGCCGMGYNAVTALLTFSAGVVLLYFIQS